MNEIPKGIAVNRIQTAITQRRKEFIASYQQGTMGKTVLTYEPALDREIYKTLRDYRFDNREAYQEVEQSLNEYTTHQVQTFIGERLNVGLSQYRYALRNGVMYGQAMTEPLVEMIARGRDCRDGIVNEHDKLRQQAEVIQFTKIQDILGNPDSEIGTTVISISPPGQKGSAYSHNFYDVFILQEDTSRNERYVASHRFASDLSLDEYKQAAEELHPGYFTEHKNEPIDSYFLSHPLTLDTKSSLSNNPEKIHKTFHKGHEFLSTEDFQEVRRAIAGLVTSYVNTLCETPDDKEFLELTLNAVMNKADAAADLLKHPVRRQEILAANKEKHIVPPRWDIMRLGHQPVRQTTTGCGMSGGFGTSDRTPSNMSSFSSIDFGKDALGSRTFSCPECGQKNIRPYNETISNCQHCGSKKVAC